MATLRFLRTPLLLLACASPLLVTTAAGQETAAEYPAACDAAKMTKADVERAHPVFLSGKQFLEESNYDKAISYFKDAYTIDCSIHAILPIIATSYERKGDKAAAIRALEEYLKRAPAAADHDVIARRIGNLREQLAHEAAAAPAASTAPSSTASSTPPTPAPVSTLPSDAVALASTASPPPTSAPVAETTSTTTKSTNPGPWIVVGLGGAAIVGSVVLYAVGIPEVNTAAKSCGSRTDCASDVANKGNDGRFLEIAGGVVGGVGIAAVGGGLLWYFLSQRSSDHGITPSVSIAPGYAGVSVADTF